jgi:hypothetical protein
MLPAFAQAMPCVCEGSVLTMSTSRLRIAILLSVFGMVPLNGCFTKTLARKPALGEATRHAGTSISEGKIMCIRSASS